MVIHRLILKEMGSNCQLSIFNLNNSKIRLDKLLEEQNQLSNFLQNIVLLTILKMLIWLLWKIKNRYTKYQLTNTQADLPLHQRISKNKTITMNRILKLVGLSVIVIRNRLQLIIMSLEGKLLRKNISCSINH